MTKSVVCLARFWKSTQIMFLKHSVAKLRLEDVKKSLQHKIEPKIAGQELCKQSHRAQKSKHPQEGG